MAAGADALVDRRMMQDGAAPLSRRTNDGPPARGRLFVQTETFVIPSPKVHAIQFGSAGEVLVSIEATDADDCRGGSLRLSLNAFRLLAPQVEAEVARYLAAQQRAA